MKKSTFILLITSSLISCSKNETNVDKQSSELSNLPVAIYSLADNYKMVENRCEVDQKGLMIKDEILSNKDVISYSKSELSFTVTAEGFAKVQKMVDAQPFVLAVAGDVALLGFFRPLMSLKVCNESVLMNTKDKNKVYFYTTASSEINEVAKNNKVNSESLIEALKSSGRLMP